MDCRFEPDLAEVSADGNYLMICANRKTIFLDGFTVGKVPLSEVSSLSARDGAIVVHTKEGAARLCPFPSIRASELERLAESLTECIDRWHQ